MNVHSIVRFSFEAAGFAPTTFSVLKFEGVEDLSRPFDFTIDLISTLPEIDLKSLIARKATLIIATERRARTIHGTVAEVEAGDEIIDGRFHYRVRFVPRIWLKRLSRHNQIHQAMSVVDVLRRELTGTSGQGVKDKSAQHLQEGRDFEFRLDGTYAPREYTVQWEESDLDFFHRLLETNGLFYYFDHAGGCDKLVICDWKMFLPAHKDSDHFQFRKRRDQAIADELVVERFNTHLRAVPQKVVLADYDDRKPHLTVQAEAKVKGPGIGVASHYGEFTRTLEETKAHARVAAAVWTARAEVFEGTGTCHPMEPGHCFALDGHFRRGFNGRYRVVRLMHKGSTEATGASDMRNEAGRRARYVNEFECLADGVEFHLERRMPRPRVDGIISAEIDAEGGGGMAEVDEHGRYKVRFFFDLSGAADGKASCWVRLATPFGGPNEGLHYPLRKGAEVIVSFLNGDPDRPVITGVVPNPATPSVVTHGNRTAYVTKTPGGVTHVMGNKLTDEVVMGGVQQNGHAGLGAGLGGHLAEEAEQPGPEPVPAAATVAMPPAQQMLDTQSTATATADTSANYNATLVESDGTGTGTILAYSRLGETAKSYDEASQGPFYTVETDSKYVDTEDASKYQSHLYVSGSALSVIEGKNQQVVRGEDKNLTYDSEGILRKYTASYPSVTGDLNFTYSYARDTYVTVGSQIYFNISDKSTVTVGTISNVTIGTKMELNLTSNFTATFGWKIDYTKAGTYKMSGGPTYEISKDSNTFTSDGIAMGLLTYPEEQAMTTGSKAALGATAALAAAGTAAVTIADTVKNAKSDKKVDNVAEPLDALELGLISANLVSNVAGVVGYYATKARVDVAKAAKQTLFEIKPTLPVGSQAALRTLGMMCELKMTDSAAGGEASLRVGVCELKVTPTAFTVAFGGVEVLSVGLQEFKYLVGGAQANSITVGNGACKLESVTGTEITAGNMSGIEFALNGLNLMSLGGPVEISGPSLQGHTFV